MIKLVRAVLVAIGPEIVKAWSEHEKRRHEERIARYAAIARRLEP